MHHLTYGDKPDDCPFLEDDKKLPDAVSAMAANAQGSHQAIVRAGEERILTWEPKLAKGEYTVRACLVYDLNRFNDMAFEGDRARMFDPFHNSQVIIVSKGSLFFPNRG